MAKITYADGTIIVTIDGCRCGNAGGCELCKPCIYKITPNLTVTILLPISPTGKVNLN